MAVVRVFLDKQRPLGNLIRENKQTRPVTTGTIQRDNGREEGSNTNHTNTGRAHFGGKAKQVLTIIIIIIITATL